MGKKLEGGGSREQGAALAAASLESGVEKSFFKKSRGKNHELFVGAKPSATVKNRKQGARVILCLS